jgi:predicted DNA-binding transcriptional regulator YafY
VISTAHLEMAISAEDVLEFDYPSSVDGQPLRRTFSPWRMKKDSTVVLGFDHDREAPRCYTLAKMAHGAIAPGESFVQPE